MDTFMERALALAEKGQYTARPNPVVGCVLVRDGKIIGEGWHQAAGEPHAEIHALLDAEKHGHSVEGATAYVTLEPCCHHGRTPPCAEALIEAKLAEVVIAMQDPNPEVSGQGIARLEQAGVIVRQLDDLAAERAQALNRGFVKRMQTGLPWVTLKTACSLDGKTAMASGESQWITSVSAREDGHRLRARAGAVLTGVGTVLADNPTMTARLSGRRVKQPVRVVLDSQLQTPEAAAILSNDSATWLVADTAARAEALAALADDIIPVPAIGEKLDLNKVLEALAGREINEVLVEAGNTLAGAFLEAGLVDEWVVYMAPDLLGANARGLAGLPGLERLADKIRFEFVSVHTLGRDLRLILQPGHC